MNISEMPTRVELLSERTRPVSKAKGEDAAAITLLEERREDAEPPAVPDPLVQALMEKLPNPNAIWALEDRAKWLRAAAIIFNLVYRAEAPVSKPIERAPNSKPSAA